MLSTNDFIEVFILKINIAFRNVGLQFTDRLTSEAIPFKIITPFADGLGILVKAYADGLDGCAAEVERESGLHKLRRVLRHILLELGTLAFG